MILAIGTRVRMIHTGDEGKVIQQLDKDMVVVRLSDGDEIPTFIEDLERMEAADREKKKTKATAASPVKRPDQPVVLKDYQVERSLGLQIAFEAVKKGEGQTDRYLIFLINDTPYELIFSLQLSTDGQVRERLNGKLPALSYQQTGELFFEELSEHPGFEIECRQVTTAGTGSPFKKSLKIKPKQFFKNLMPVPLIDRPMHHFVLIDKFEKVEKSDEDLQTYTQRNQRRQFVNENFRHLSRHQIEEMANFPTEIDLHIENLTEKAAGMSNADILRVQLQHFDKYLSKAIELGLDRVFIIHGVGKGKLRDAIATRLFQWPGVTTFRNEFHPSYGFGATEVIIGDK